MEFSLQRLLSRACLLGGLGALCSIYTLPRFFYYLRNKLQLHKFGLMFPFISIFGHIIRLRKHTFVCQVDKVYAHKWEFHELDHWFNKQSRRNVWGGRSWSSPIFCNQISLFSIKSVSLFVKQFYSLVWLI